MITFEYSCVVVCVGRLMGAENGDDDRSSEQPNRPKKTSKTANFLVASGGGAGWAV
jgi:hypothetical protein